MKAKWEKIQNGNVGTMAMGLHCTTLYCPHLGHCSAVGDTAIQMAAVSPPPTSVHEPLVPLEALLAKVTTEPGSDEEAGYSQAVVSAVNRQTKYVTASNKARLKDGGKVTYQGHVWEDRGNGCRWHKK
jgi:hypothetical protein